MIFEITFIFTLILAILLLTIPKKYFLIPFVLTACFIPADQRVQILDLDFQSLRILILVGFTRSILLGEKLTFKFNKFDKLLFAWAFYSTIIYIIQWANMSAIIFRCGYLFDIIGMYWIFRTNINSLYNIRLAIITFAVCCLIIAVFVSIEFSTGQNPFVILGLVKTLTREGLFRCQASFPNAIILGLFWATMIPLFIGFAKVKKHRLLLWLAIGACIFIIPATASSTPILTALIAIALLIFYKRRQYIKYCYWATIFLLLFLHVIMIQPLLYLFDKMSIIPGSTGYQRYYILRQSVIHFNEWVLLGCRSTAHWGPGLFDITNQYVIEGVTGGLLTLIIFITMLVIALKSLYNLSLKHPNHKMRFLFWCIFVTMFSHCVAFFGTPYFGQMRMWWFMTLAIVSFISEMETHILHKTYNQIKTIKYAPEITDIQ